MNDRPFCAQHVGRFWLRMFLVLFVFMSLDPVVLASEERRLPGVSVTPKRASAEESVLVSVQLRAFDREEIERISIDASELGVDTLIPVDLALLSQTVPLRFDLTSGSKALTLIVRTTDGETLEIPFEVEISDVSSNVPRWDQAVIYFLLTDRFADGDPTNNDPHGIGYDLEHPETYHGGDFQGIIDNLDYLEALGINMIWITPIVDNIEHDARHGREGSQYAYHGYWAKDFETIDEHLGDLETFHRLIDEAAERDIRLILDVVLNHAGYGMKVTDVGEDIEHFPSAEDQERFRGMLRENPEPHSVRGELMGLPDFITEDPLVRQALVDWQAAWLEKSMTAEGNRLAAFRVDTVKHADLTLWRHFKNELTRRDPSFKLLGEWYDATVDNDGGALWGGGMDALLDFGFKDIAQTFIRGDVERAERQLNHRNQKIDNTRLMAQFLGSHDEDGFLLTRANDDLGLFKVAVSLQLTAKGIPVIYYGEEIGMSGKTARDMDKGEFSQNRDDFRWPEVQDNDLLAHYRQVIAIRNQYAPLFARGERDTLLASNDPGVSVFLRTLDGESVLLALNRSDRPQIISFQSDLPPALLVDLYAETPIEGSGAIELTIPAASDGGTLVLYLAEHSVAEVELLTAETGSTGGGDKQADLDVSGQSGWGERQLSLQSQR